MRRGQSMCLRQLVKMICWDEMRSEGGLIERKVMGNEHEHSM
jgi:hypothetical protein